MLSSAHAAHRVRGRRAGCDVADDTQREPEEHESAGDEPEALAEAIEDLELEPDEAASVKGGGARPGAQGA